MPLSNRRNFLVGAASFSAGGMLPAGTLHAEDRLEFHRREFERAFRNRYPGAVCRVTDNRLSMREVEGGSIACVMFTAARG